MRRETFLNENWLNYPAACAGIRDCSQFLNEKQAAKVGGRLIDRDGQWSLYSEGSEIQFEFDQAAKWSSDCLRANDPVVFSPSVLRSGDLVWLELKLHSQRQAAIASGEVCLLFAVDESSAHKMVVFPKSTAESWSQFVDAVRSFFKASGFLELRTPTLVPSPGTEPFLDPFETDLVFGAHNESRYLPTSPEFHLKKLLVSGYTKIFELKDCFRNREQGSHHQAEFLMLEWYRAYASLDEIAEDAKRLLNAVARALGKPEVNLKRTTIASLFKSALGFNLTPKTTREELIELAHDQSVFVDASEPWDDLYFRIFLERIEPRLEKEGALLISDYPPSQAALARINKDGWADRFEIYWNGLEVANAFHELNDPKANEARFAKDHAERARLGKPAVPNDTELIEKLHAGMPPSGGIALGMDRLFMAVMGIAKIEETRPFPLR